jgi:hypothetical protein
MVRRSPVRTVKRIFDGSSVVSPLVRVRVLRPETPELPPARP